jgi:protein phosphatase PTC1
MKDLVTGHPYTTETVIQPDLDEFIILACDGVSNSMYIEKEFANRSSYGTSAPTKKPSTSSDTNKTPSPLLSHSSTTPSLASALTTSPA